MYSGSDAAEGKEGPTTDWDEASNSQMSLEEEVLWQQFDAETDKTVYVAQPVNDFSRVPEAQRLL